MRLFTGIPLPAHVAGNLEQLLAKLQPTASLRWSRVENLHITTKFIGEWAERRLPELGDALNALPGRDSIAITVRGLGWFPNPHVPRVFWVAVQAPPQLAELARDIEECLARLGVAREERAFAPHLTLARIKSPGGLHALRGAIAELPSVEFGSFTADRFYLYESRRGSSGTDYTKLSEFRFFP